MPLNPNAARDEVNSYVRKTDADKARSYPQFFTKLELNTFRHITNLLLSFEHPITVISGSNKSGKTSALMAIACSHFNFKRHNVTNGNWERATWSKMMRFTANDAQTTDWNYHVSFREGNSSHSVHGYRRQASGKWGGAAKKSRQIGHPTTGNLNGGREVTLIDLNRITPGRHLSQSYFNKARYAHPIAVANQVKINDYLSYILEDNYRIEELAKVADGRVYKYTTTSSYSSFNTASGEDVLSIILADILQTAPNSLILIDEIEVGLHPKIQRRLMDVLYMISKDEHKQFILTTHSYAILNSVPRESRLFIESNAGVFNVIKGLSTYEALTRMDSSIFPVTTIYVEDEESQRIVDNALAELNADDHGISRMFKIVIVGPASKTYDYFSLRKKLRQQEQITTKASCILDGDMQNVVDNNGSPQYPAQDGLFFHFTDEAPEKMLLRKYLANHPNDTMQYHVDNSNPHCLLQKMVDEGLAINKNKAFDICFDEYRNSADGSLHFEELKQFLLNQLN